MSDEGLQITTEWARQSRLFGIVIAATSLTLIGYGLIFTFVGEWVGVGLVQRIAIGLALTVVPLAISISLREPPEGRLLVAMRSAFFTAYAAVAVGAAIMVWDENLELLTMPIYTVLLFSIIEFYERCVQRLEFFGIQ